MRRERINPCNLLRIAGLKPDGARQQNIHASTAYWSTTIVHDRTVPK
jgi:hypothetical protein